MPKTAEESDSVCQYMPDSQPEELPGTQQLKELFFLPIIMWTICIILCKKKTCNGMDPARSLTREVFIKKKI